jgi:hypothetical protein
MSRPHAADAVVIVVAGIGAMFWMEIVKRTVAKRQQGSEVDA